MPLAGVGVLGVGGVVAAAEGAAVVADGVAVVAGAGDAVRVARETQPSVSILTLTHSKWKKSVFADKEN